MSYCLATLQRRLLEWLADDAPHGDLTSELVVPRGLRAEAVVLAKSRGVAACTWELAEALEGLGVEAKALVADGSEVGPGDVVMRLRGEARRILLVERTLLNLLIYLYGVATTTRLYVERARSVNPRIRVAATRKYPPGLGCLAKRAVRAGGGDTHRFSLSDAILIKDNHIRLAGSVEEALRRALAGRGFMHRVEVEVSTVEDAVRAAEAGADVVMFDNMSPGEIGEAIEALKARGLRGRVVLEASGGIDLDNIVEYARLDLDVVSTSRITMNPVRVDLSLEVVRP